MTTTELPGMPPLTVDELMQLRARVRRASTTPNVVFRDMLVECDRALEQLIGQGPIAHGTVRCHHNEDSVLLQVGPSGIAISGDGAVQLAQALIKHARAAGFRTPFSITIGGE